MTDGLEISVMHLKEAVGAENTTGRIDAEYFKKEYLLKINVLKKLHPVPLERRAKIFGGKRLPLNASFSEDGIKYARAEDVKGKFLNVDHSPRISKRTHEILKRYQTFYQDVLLTTVGNSIGDVAINKRNEIINLTENCVRIQGEDPEINAYLLCFLHSAYGQFQIKRETVGTAQPKLAIERIRLFQIPECTDTFYRAMDHCVESGWQKLQRAHELYRNAAKLLDEEIGGCPMSDRFMQVKALSHSFGQSGRLDAEYYQPKYERMTAQLHTTETVSSLCKVHDANFIPDDEAKYRYIELSDVGAEGDISNVEKIAGLDLPSRARRIVKAGQVIVSSVEGSLNRCALIGDEYHGALCSTGFYVVDSHEINSETLLILFKSPLIQALLKQRCSGTILTAVSKEEFLNLPLPNIEATVQEEISNKVRESFRLRREAGRLLDHAVMAVEMAVETNEDAALAALAALEAFRR